MIFHSNSSTQPANLEVTGILVPFKNVVADQVYKFKIDNGGSTEYILRMNKTLEQIAKLIAWEEVTVKGHLNMQNNILDVERIKVSPPGDALKPDDLEEKSYLDDDEYESSLRHEGKIEPPIDFMAS